MPPERLRLRDIRNTSTFRLTALLGLVFAGGVVALLGLIYSLSVRELTVRTDLIMRQQIVRLEHVSPDALPARMQAEIASSTHGLNYFLLISASGERLLGNMEQVPIIRLRHDFDIAARGAHGPLRALAARTPGGETILVARDISTIIDLRRRVLRIVVGSGIAIAISVLAIGVALSLRPLRRVRDMQRASLRIAAGDLAVRMPLAGRGDELDLFAGTVNVMVEEVGRVVAQVKGVTDAVAHDLRTPLTRVRSHLYRVLQTPALDPAVAALAEAATADLTVVLERFAALLRIAELEAGARRSGFGAVDLGMLVDRVRDLYEPLAEERGISLEASVAAHAQTHGDEQLLFEAISNLVDNAIKFAPERGHVDVRVRHDGGTPVVEVQDDGPGIAVDQRQAVLRRFHRGADTADIAGAGLGLSIVTAITHLHSFTLSLDDAAPGLIARLICNRPGLLAIPE
jgi:signal transduction histidine kinase